MPKLEQVSLPGLDTVEELRRGVEATLNRLISRLNVDKVTEDVDNNDHRIRNLRGPIERRDAVNKAYVDDADEALDKQFRVRLRLLEHRADQEDDSVTIDGVPVIY